MLKAIKIRLYLTKEQVNYTNNLLGTSRFIYNNLLAYKISEYFHFGKSGYLPLFFYLIMLFMPFNEIKQCYKNF